MLCRLVPEICRRWMVSHRCSDTLSCFFLLLFFYSSASFLAPRAHSGLSTGPFSSSSLKVSFLTDLRLDLKSTSEVLLATILSLSNFETFLRAGFTNFPRRSLTWIVSSLIKKSFCLTSYSRSYLASSRAAIRLWYCLRIPCSVASLQLSTGLGAPMRSAMIFFLCSAFLSCSFLSSSAAIFLSRVLSFFLRSGVMKPRFPPDFLALAASSRRLRTSAFLRSFSSIFLFSSSFSRLWASSASLLLRSVSDSSPMLLLAFWTV
uniref:Uncharacterized protein n=1 Tax=Ixodes ricinus TaxID=34613 RepID=A0A6B0V683_IXORI